MFASVPGMGMILSLTTPGHGSQWGLMVHMVFIHSMLVSTVQSRNIAAEYVHRVGVTSYSAAIHLQRRSTLYQRYDCTSRPSELVWYMHCSIFNTKKIKWNLLSCNSVFLTHSTNAVIRVCKYGHELLSHVHGFDSTFQELLFRMQQHSGQHELWILTLTHARVKQMFCLLLQWLCSKVQQLE